jgi:hypothetical protein
LVATKRPNRVGERAGNAQEAEPRQNLKRGAGGARRRPTTEQRSRGCAPLGWGVLAHQAALNNSKTGKTGRRTCSATSKSFIADLLFLSEAPHSFLVPNRCWLLGPPARTPIWHLVFAFGGVGPGGTGGWGAEMRWVICDIKCAVRFETPSSLLLFRWQCCCAAAISFVPLLLPLLPLAAAMS